MDTPFGPSTSFVSTTSFRPSPARLNYTTVDARHGRVLLHVASWNHELELDDSFVVWDPVMGGERTRLPLLPRSRYRSTSVTWNAAVLCASAGAGACDHLDCHSRPFLVVHVTRGRRWGRHGMCAHVYSSEAAAWSRRIYAPRLVADMKLVPTALAGNSLYFMCIQSVLKFDLATREMSLIDLPQETFRHTNTMLRTTDEGALGLAAMCSDELYLWSREVGPDGAQSKIIKPVVPSEPLCSLRLAGFAHGLGAILVGKSERVFTIDLKSTRVTKVSEERRGGGFTFPYMSFYTPALGAAASAE